METKGTSISGVSGWDRRGLLRERGGTGRMDEMDYLKQRRIPLHLLHKRLNDFASLDIYAIIRSVRSVSLAVQHV